MGQARNSASKNGMAPASLPTCSAFRGTGSAIQWMSRDPPACSLMPCITSMASGSPLRMRCATSTAVPAGHAATESDDIPTEFFN